MHLFTASGMGPRASFNATTSVAKGIIKRCLSQHKANTSRGDTPI